MKHNCNQYTIELLYNELIIIKSSSHFNLQPWKWEIKLNNEQEEKQRISVCAGELAMEDRQKEVSSPVCNTWGASLLNSFQCWSRRENAKSPSEFCEQRSQFLTKKPVPAKEAQNQSAQSETYFKYQLRVSIFVF